MEEEKVEEWFRHQLTFDECNIDYYCSYDIIYFNYNIYFRPILL